MKEFPTRIGILGGGQLARMLALACYELGAEPVLFVSPRAHHCAALVVSEIVLDRGDLKSLKTFAASVDLLIIENEFLDLNRLKAAIGKTPLYPSLDCLGQVQSKKNQKLRLKVLKIPTLDFKDVADNDKLKACLKEWKGPAVLKKSNLAYDGHGTFFLKPQNVNLDYLKNLGWPFDSYLEEFADFKKELAVIVARGINGQCVSYPVIETSQREGKCDSTIVPALVPPSIAKKAQKIALAVIQGFGGVGVFGVEMFWLKEGRVVVNEIAPRVHNSGHVTMNGFNIGQFELHLRAVMGLPLISPLLQSRGAAMQNVIGKKKFIITDSTKIKIRNSQLAGTWVHWYHKQGPVLGRKLGHINAVSKKSGADALKNAQKIRKLISL